MMAAENSHPETTVLQLLKEFPHSGKRLWKAMGAEIIVEDAVDSLFVGKPFQGFRIVPEKLPDVRLVRNVYDFLKVRKN